MLSLFSRNQELRTKLAVVRAKFWMTLASVSITFNLLIVLTLVQMAPKLKAIAQILPSPMSTTEHIQIDTLPAPGFLSTDSLSNKVNRELLDEMLIRYYVDRRISTFADKNEMNSRWGRFGDISRLSAPPVYSKFAKGLAEKIKQIGGLKETKSVDIVHISKLGNTYTVEFDVYTFNQYDSTVRPRVQRRSANIIIGHHPKRAFFSGRFSNPFGFYIQQYDEAVKR